ncbi:dihydroorotate dehydrogenase-like protein [candidate division KSB3 bacterium]|uniref:Dihydroorotate dehydrogenase-like protein n=1 Tax=candidate division KSB3 bacterium TaxID=2044937 RepID=A0A9D5JX04_9BACT|nr:dihydroorotate dehydrogenase-like protein [candidate division KSB3 bacterium]MBD3325793.1 dihydroorotate dehydrogenase-like protein [candidate division KSB3 bacterium]
MVDLSTTYLGLPLKNPFIVGSSGLTDTVVKVQDLARHGAAAVVLKSIFEEEIALEFQDILRNEAPQGQYLEHFDYLDYQIRERNLETYTQLIMDCKVSVAIPVIASVNCTYAAEWAFFAKQLQNAGADALELNMYFLPSDVTRSSEDLERAYFDVIARVTHELSIPVSLKISPYFSSLAHLMQEVCRSGIAGLVLFNRFSSPDFDIEGLRVVTKHTFSTPAEYLLPLRWIALMSDRVECDLVGSTGIHDGRAMIKLLLAGAQVVQVVSALYQQGNTHIQAMLSEVEKWMQRQGFTSLEEFRGTLSQAHSANPGVYERVQYMRQFGGQKA